MHSGNDKVLPTIYKQYVWQTQGAGSGYILCVAIMASRAEGVMWPGHQMGKKYNYIIYEQPIAVAIFLISEWCVPLLRGDTFTCLKWDQTKLLITDHNLEYQRKSSKQ